jgi:hypothetical protein
MICLNRADQGRNTQSRYHIKEVLENSILRDNRTTMNQMLVAVQHADYQPMRRYIYEI